MSDLTWAEDAWWLAMFGVLFVAFVVMEIRRPPVTCRNCPKPVWKAGRCCSCYFLRRRYGTDPHPGQTQDALDRRYDEEGSRVAKALEMARTQAEAVRAAGGVFVPNS